MKVLAKYLSGLGVLSTMVPADEAYELILKACRLSGEENGEQKVKDFAENEVKAVLSRYVMPGGSVENEYGVYDA